MADHRSMLYGPSQYIIEVYGRLNPNWMAHFSGMQLKDGTRSAGYAITCMTGQVTDQAELYGLIGRMRDLGLVLVSINRLDES